MTNGLTVPQLAPGHGAGGPGPGLHGAGEHPGWTAQPALRPLQIRRTSTESISPGAPGTSSPIGLCRGEARRTPVIWAEGRWPGIEVSVQSTRAENGMDSPNLSTPLPRSVVWRKTRQLELPASRNFCDLAGGQTLPKSTGPGPVPMTHPLGRATGDCSFWGVKDAFTTPHPHTQNSFLSFQFFLGVGLRLQH